MLPHPATVLVGRESEVASLNASLTARDGPRLVTIGGTGGIGKTRVALEVARDYAELRRGPVTWVELGALTDPALVLTKLAQTLELADLGADGLLARLRQLLSAQRGHSLVVLDNFEQLLDAAPRLSDLLAAIPSLTLLVTSRSPLKLAGEHFFPLPTLTVPESDDLKHVEAAAAAQMFMQRARAVRSELTLKTADNAVLVARLCRALDGIPLAIELAAARLRILTLGEVVTGLADQLQLLSDGDRDRPPRQQTLRGTIDWSYQLLSDQARAVFVQLAVFRGGFDIPAAAAVTRLARAALLDTLTALVDHGLVLRSESETGETRFGLPETIRMFAREQLAEGEPAACALHAAHYAALARRAFPARYGDEHGLWLRRLHVDHENFRAALRHFRTALDPTGVELAGLLGWFWEAYDLLHEGTQELASCLALPDANNALSWQYFGTLLRHQSDYARSVDAYQRSLELSRQQENWSGCGEVLAGLGEVDFRKGAYGEARHAYEQALDLAQRTGADRLLIDAWNDLGRTAWVEGHPEQARELHLKSLSRSEAVPYRHGMAWSHNALGEIDRAEQRYALAADHFSAAARLFEVLHEQGPRALSLQNLAFVRLAEGKVPEALQRFEASLRLWQKGGARHGLALSLVGMAGVALAQGGPALAERSAALLGLADRLLDEIGARLESTDRNDYDRIAAQARSRLPLETYSREHGRGRELTADELLANWPEPRPTAHPSGLTNRELEVLHLLAEGLSNASISEKLIMSPHTVTVHLKTIYRKIDVHNRTAAARWARQHGVSE